MASPQAQDIAPAMRPTKSSGPGGSGKVGRPFGRPTKKKPTRTPRKRAGGAGARKGAAGRRGAGSRAKKKR